MIYQEKLETLKERLDLLVVSSSMAAVLEAQGKAGDRKSCQASLDSIRVARRAELPALLPTFHVSRRLSRWLLVLACSRRWACLLCVGSDLGCCAVLCLPAPRVVVGKCVGFTSSNNVGALLRPRPSRAHSQRHRGSEGCHGCRWHTVRLSAAGCRCCYCRLWESFVSSAFLVANRTRIVSPEVHVLVLPILPAAWWLRLHVSLRTSLLAQGDWRWELSRVWCRL